MFKTFRHKSRHYLFLTNGKVCHFMKDLFSVCKYNRETWNDEARGGGGECTSRQ